LLLAYRGDVNVTDFASVDKTTRQDFLNWKSLYLGGIDFALEPLKVSVNQVALTDFFARIILSAQGRLNLQDIVRQPGEAAQSVTDVELRKRPAPRGPPGGGRDATQNGGGASPLDGSGGEQAAAPNAPARTAAPSRAAAQAKPAKSARAAKGASGEAIDSARRELAAKIPDNIRIGKITLQGGNINFSDFFIRPNYTANLTGIGGLVTEMTAQKAGDVELRGKVDNTAPVEIVGRVNALAPELFVDLAASATDIELPPLSPYSIKYAGYGIERGKLTMKVKYLIEDRKLTAENNLYLDQLTFGPKVESPTATKLPVLLAVALLKDRNGVIDINLPISGTIDDPQFSIWGIIGKVILNLLTKAVTAPFSVLASLAGSKEELSYIEFQPGSAKLSGGDEGKLKSLAKALDDRPQLKLDVSGRVDAEADREALREVFIERKVKEQNWQALRREGKAPATAEEVTVDKGEYEKYLRLAYRAEDFPKPRNAVGMVKDLPVEEMENLMRTNAQVSDEDLRVLANQRAQAAKSWIVEQGKIAADRVFLVAPKLSAEDVKDKGKAARVDFTIR
jgi:flagellar motor protein MotB